MFFFFQQFLGILHLNEEPLHIMELSLPLTALLGLLF